METNLYRSRGAAKITAREPDWSRAGERRRSQLSVSDGAVELKLGLNTKKLAYQDIDHIEIGTDGYIWFIAKQPNDSFAFAPSNIEKLVGVIQATPLTIPPSEIKNIRQAKLNSLIYIIILLPLLLLIWYVVSRYSAPIR